MEDKYKHKILTIPNLLSLFRLLLIPVLLWLYVVRQDYLWAAGVLVLSAATDIIDGIIARKFHMVSDFGKAFDPVADKLTQLAMLICLVTRFRWMLLPLILLVVKESVSLVVGLLVIRRTGTVPAAVWHGKAATVSLYGMMLVHVLWFTIPAGVSGLLIGGCAAMMLLSGILYALRYFRILLPEKVDV